MKYVVKTGSRDGIVYIHLDKDGTYVGTYRGDTDEEAIELAKADIARNRPTDIVIGEFEL